MQEHATVSLVDADEETQELVRSLVGSAGLAMETFPDAATFLKAFRPTQPGCLIVNAGMPGTDGLELQKELVARKVSVPVIVTVERDDLATAVAALKAGAVDIVERPLVASRLRASIDQAIAQDLASRAGNTQCNEIRRRYAELTQRERQVLDLVAVGMSSRPIASRLGLREKTVEVYRSHIKRKMRAHNVADLGRMVHCIN